MERVPRPEGRIVQVANFPTRYEADAAIDLLRADGISATGKYGDADGWAPNFALLDGYRVMVFEEDLEAAEDLLRAEELLELGEAEPPSN